MCGAHKTLCGSRLVAAVERITRMIMCVRGLVMLLLVLGASSGGGASTD